MAAFSCSRYLLVFFLLNLYSKSVLADKNFTFSFKNFGKDSNFESHLALFGDAKVVGGGDGDNVSVQIAGSRVSSSGRVVCKEPITLVKSRNMVSFSNYFVFSMSGGNGDGLAFVMLPFDFPLSEFDGGSMGMLLGAKKSKFLAVEFDTFEDRRYGDVNRNHVGLDVDSLVSVKVGNASSLNVTLDGGEKLQAWIDYEASGKRFEVRLSKFGDNKPNAPLLSYPIDLSKMWKDENVTVGFISSSGNSLQKSVIYSWSFNSRIAPIWMHSEPMDPEGVAEKGEVLKVLKRNTECGLRILLALLFGSGCGAIGALVVLYLWTVFGNRRPVVPEEFTEQSKEFECVKFDVTAVGTKTVEDGKE